MADERTHGDNAAPQSVRDAVKDESQDQVVLIDRAVAGLPTETDPQLWLVGAHIGGEDQTARFVREGIWEIRDPSDRSRDLISTMREGDPIAIKSAFTQSVGLPFATNGRRASVMRIKARGKIKRVADQTVLVDWEPVFEPRDWYMYTARAVIWRVPSTDPFAEGLRAFVLDDAPQDYDWYLKRGHWGEQFGFATGQGSRVEAPERFDWIPAYMAIADELVSRRADRAELVKILHRVRKDNGQRVWHDRFEDGTDDVLADIEPGTFMSIFNFGPTPSAARS